MPLILVCGTPCSGKSYCAEFLKDYFDKLNKNVILISDEDYLLTNQRNLVFKGILYFFTISYLLLPLIIIINWLL